MDELFWPNLGSIKNIEVKIGFLSLNSLNSKVPLRVRAIINGFHQILAVKVRILTCKLQGFVLSKRVDSEFRYEMKIHEITFALLDDQSIDTDTESLHHAI